MFSILHLPPIIIIYCCSYVMIKPKDRIFLCNLISNFIHFCSLMNTYKYHQCIPMFVLIWSKLVQIRSYIHQQAESMRTTTNKIHVEQIRHFMGIYKNQKAQKSASLMIPFATDCLFSQLPK